MLYEIMRYCRNFFAVNSKIGKWEIVGGKIRLPFLLDGQYFLIKGSVFNDGVYKYPAEELTEEKFFSMASWTRSAIS